ncbi:hypothetical protein [Methylophaga sp.]|uniref:hypothetical protein n=1 Tax=Methylophaga sp. TaxID=2024840 RepID=UPI0030DCC26C
MNQYTPPEAGTEDGLGGLESVEQVSRTKYLAIESWSSLLNQRSVNHGYIKHYLNGLIYSITS